MHEISNAFDKFISKISESDLKARVVRVVVLGLILCVLAAVGAIMLFNSEFAIKQDNKVFETKYINLFLGR